MDKKLTPHTIIKMVSMWVLSKPLQQDSRFAREASNRRHSNTRQSVWNLRIATTPVAKLVMSFNDLSPGAVFGIVFAICVVISIVYAAIYASIWHYINVRGGGEPEYFPVGSGPRPGPSTGNYPRQVAGPRPVTKPSPQPTLVTTQTGPQAAVCPSVPIEVQ